MSTVRKRTTGRRFAGTVCLLVFTACPPLMTAHALERTLAIAVPVPNTAVATTAISNGAVPNSGGPTPNPPLPNVIVPSPATSDAATADEKSNAVGLTPAPAASTAPSPSPSVIQFIVNRENPTTELSPAELGNLFLKRKREWNDGTDVRFIDRKDGSKPRTVFLSDFLKRTGRDVELYWIGQKLYAGDSAPMQVDGDESVVSLVTSLRGAIGYVTVDCPLGPGVKKINVEMKTP